ncbi:hypothetical protein R6Q57_024957 [Mikania cordata]
MLAATMILGGGGSNTPGRQQRWFKVRIRSSIFPTAMVPPCIAVTARVPPRAVVATRFLGEQEERQKKAKKLQAKKNKMKICELFLNQVIMNLVNKAL